MDKNRPDYIGSITNKGVQDIQAPISQTSAKTGSIKTGSDLRGGKASK